MSDNDRPAALDRCPSDETLAAWFDGRLTAIDVQQVEAHVAGCASCAELVAAIAPMLTAPEFELAAPPPARAGGTPDNPPRPLLVSSRPGGPVTPQQAGRAAPPARRLALRSLLVVAAAVVAAAGGVSLVQFQRRPEPPVDLSALSAAQGPSRPTYGRLSEFAWAEPPPTERGGADVAGEPGTALRAAAAAIVRAYDQQTSSRALHATGVAALVAGDLDDAVARLDAAVAASPRDARIANDAAVAHLQRAWARSDDESLRQARRLAELAVRERPAAADAWFNLASIGRLAGDQALVDRALDAFRRLEPDTEWRRELQAW